MTPKEKASQLEKNIKAMHFQIDTFRGRRIATIIIDTVISEYLEIEKVYNINATDPIRYWNEVKEEIIPLF